MTLQFLAMPDRSYVLLVGDHNPQGPWSQRRVISSAAFVRPITISDILPEGLRARYYRLVTPGNP